MAEMRAKLGLSNAEFNTGLQQAQVKLKEFNEQLANPVAGVGAFVRNLPMIGGFIALLQTGIYTVKAFGEGLEHAFKSALEQRELEADMQAFYGSVDQAKAKLKEFYEYAVATPFDTHDVAEGAFRFDVLTDKALNSAKSLRMIGDAAAATDHSFSETAKAIGFLYSSLSSGQSVDRALMMMQRMGIITPDVITKLKGMQSAGDSTAVMWKEVAQALSRFDDTTDAVTNSAAGSMDRIKANWLYVLRTFSLPIIDALTPYLRLAAQQSDKARESADEMAGSTQHTLTVFQAGMYLLSSLWAGLQAIWTSLVYAWNDLDNIVSTFVATAIIDWKTLGAVINDVLTLNWTKIKDDLKNGYAEMLQISKDGQKAFEDNAKDAGNSLMSIGDAWNKSYDATFGSPNSGPVPKGKAGDGVNGEGAGGDGGAVEAEQIAAQRDELSDLQAAAREKTMTDLQKINDLESRRTALLGEAAKQQEQIANLDPKKDAGPIQISTGLMLKAQIEAARLDEQIGQAQEEMDRKKDEAAKSLAAKRKELSDLEASARDKTLTDLQKINDMESRRQSFIDDSEIQQRAGNEDQAVADKIEAAKLTERIGEAQETREQTIAALKQKILEEQDKLLTRQERIAALQAEKAALDVNNPDEEISLKAKARSLEIDDEIKQMDEKHPPLAKQVHTSQIIDSDIHGGNARHHSMAELAGQMAGIRLVARGIDIKIPDEPKKQTALQQKMVEQLETLVKNSKAGSSSFKIPMARFGNGI